MYLVIKGFVQKSQLVGPNNEMTFSLFVNLLLNGCHSKKKKKKEGPVNGDLGLI